MWKTLWKLCKTLRAHEIFWKRLLVCLWKTRVKRKNKEISFSDTVEVWIRKINEEDIKWYIENDKDILDRSGYSMLGKAAIFLEKVNGDYNTLFGISPSKVYENLQELGYNISDFELNADN